MKAEGVYGAVEAGGFRLPLTQKSSQALVERALLGEKALPQACVTQAGHLYSYQEMSSHREAVCVIGAFDGLHKGHQSLLTAALSDAHAYSLPLVAITFSPDPSEVLCPKHEEPRLLSVEDRIRGLLSYGADAVLVVPFTKALAQSSPENFIDSIFTSLRPVVVHVGANFRFGAHGAGSIATLEKLSRTYGYRLAPQSLLTFGGAPLSATRIRALLACGAQLEEAALLLGRCHFVRGTVVHGRGEGTGMGFATANIEAPSLSALPGAGVYAGYSVVDGKAWASAINVGAPKMFDQSFRPTFMESHLLGFDGDLYGREVEVIFCSWLRPTIKFLTVDELVQAVHKDIEWVHENLSAC